jgi:predicted nucleic acid-binding Zn ribbon protein
LNGILKHKGKRKKDHRMDMLLITAAEIVRM